MSGTNRTRPWFTAADSVSENVSGQQLRNRANLPPTRSDMFGSARVVAAQDSNVAEFKQLRLDVGMADHGKAQMLIGQPCLRGDLEQLA